MERWIDEMDGSMYKQNNNMVQEGGFDGYMIKRLLDGWMMNQQIDV